MQTSRQSQNSIFLHLNTFTFKLWVHEVERSTPLPHHSVMCVGLPALPQKKNQDVFRNSNARSYFVIAPMSKMLEYSFHGGGRDSSAREHPSLPAASPGKGTGNDGGCLWLQEGMLPRPGGEQPLLDRAGRRQPPHSPPHPTRAKAPDLRRSSSFPPPAHPRPLRLCGRAAITHLVRYISVPLFLLVPVKGALHAAA